jgi:hypothetical protein
VETVVILSLTVALAAGVVWWVTSGQIPSFFTGRRGGRPTTPPFGSEEISGPGSTATQRWPRAHTEPPRRRAPEGRRAGVVRHRSSRATFTYTPLMRDQRPPVALTILKIVLIVAIVAGLLAGGIWAAGEFLTSFMEKLIQ